MVEFLCVCPDRMAVRPDLKVLCVSGDLPLRNGFERKYRMHKLLRKANRA